MVKVCFSEGIDGHLSLPVGNTANFINVKHLSRFSIELVEDTQGEVIT